MLERRQNPWIRAPQVLAAVLLLCGVLRWVTPPWLLHPDVGWFLYAADAWQRGAVPYRDLVEVNPPLVLYLNWLVVSLAAGLDLRPTLLYRLLMLGLVLGCFLLCLACRPRAWQNWGVGMALWAALLLGVGLDFGQREHLLACLAAPWLLGCCRRDLGEADLPLLAAVMVGGLAGLGLALKPQFLLIPLLVWARAALRRGPGAVLRAPESLGLGGVLLAYVLHLPLLPFAGDLAATMSSVWQGYGAYRCDLWTLLLPLAWILPLLILVLPLAHPGARGTLAMAVCGAALAYLWQGKGWSYHLLPLMALLLGLLTGGLLAGPRPRGFGPLGVCLLLLGFGLSLAAHLFDRSPEAGLVRAAPATQIGPDFAAIRELGAGDALLVLDTGIPSFFAWMVDHRLHWSSRYACLWPLPAATGDAAALQRLRRQVLADLTRHPCDLLYLPRGALRHVPDREFRMLTWLGGANALAALGYQEVAGPAQHHLFRRR